MRQMQTHQDERRRPPETVKTTMITVQKSPGAGDHPSTNPKQNERCAVVPGLTGKAVRAAVGSSLSPDRRLHLTGLFREPGFTRNQTFSREQQRCAMLGTGTQRAIDTLYSS